MRREDTPEEAAFRAEVREWLEANAEPRAEGAPTPLDHSPEAEARHWEAAKRWQRTKFEGGWAAITWPVEYGGRGGTPIQQMIWNEEQAAFDVPAGFISASLGMIGPALMRFGTEEQKAYLPAMLRGDEVWCQLFSEPEAGSDLAAVRTRGEVDGDELVINGQKVWTTSANFAEKGFIVLRTNPDVPKHDGISFALIDMRRVAFDGQLASPLSRQASNIARQTEFDSVNDTAGIFFNIHRTRHTCANTRDLNLLKILVFLRIDAGGGRCC